MNSLESKRGQSKRGQTPHVNVLATMVDGRVVHEEAVDWEPPEEWLGLDIYGYHGEAQ